MLQITTHTRIHKMCDKKMIYGNIYADGHSNNSMFEEEDRIHRFNPTQTPRLLRQAFLNQGIEINTPDVNKGRQITFDLHMEARKLAGSSRHKYLIALENPNINQLNENSNYCRQFSKVFTWDKRLFHLSNAIPILIPYPITQHDSLNFEERNIFSCLINANKAFKRSLASDLYLERIKTIRWYEQHAPEMFALYGMGWEKSTPAYNFWGKVQRSTSRLRTRLFGQIPFPSYKGEVKDKGEILRQSKFSYCYENSKNLSNYITEKIFDSLVNGCVPIYWGADNVEEHIPENCFVDRRKFKNTSEVHEHLLSISEKEYKRYQDNIFQFLESNDATKFSSKYIASTIVKHVCRDIESTYLTKNLCPPDGNIQ